MMSTSGLAGWVVSGLLAASYLVGTLSFVLELIALRRPFRQGLSGAARRAWRLSGFCLLGLTVALTLNFWVQAQFSGNYWLWRPATSWALILWLALLAYRRGRFQLTLSTWQLLLLNLGGLAFFAIGAWLLLRTLGQG